MIAKLPATRYYGSKRKLLPWLYSSLGHIEFNTVLDAFGGTGSVSLLFKLMRKSVTFHDGLKFNEDVGRTVLATAPAIPLHDVLAFIDGVEPEEGIIASNFEDVFYTNDENRWLDGFFSKLAKSELDDSEAALFRYLIYQACLKKRPFNLFHRANLSIRLNQGVDRRFGNAVTWERSFKHHMLEAFADLSKTPSPPSKQPLILSAGNADNITPGYDLVYIDPPYINAKSNVNRDGYWQRYHFLEGLANYSRWGEKIDKTSKIRLFEGPTWLSDWSRKDTFKDLLFAFISRHRSSVCVLSYVAHAFPSEEAIKAHFEDLFGRVTVHSAEHHHALSNSRKRELLFIGYPR